MRPLRTLTRHSGKCLSKIIQSTLKDLLNSKRRLLTESILSGGLRAAAGYNKQVQRQRDWGTNLESCFESSL